MSAGTRGKKISVRHLPEKILQAGTPENPRGEAQHDQAIQVSPMHEALHQGGTVEQSPDQA
jgi:hypothetical protein